MILELGDALRASSLRLARIGRVQSVIEESPGTRDILARYIAGDTTQSALGAARDLMETGRAVTVSYLGPDADSRARSDATVDEYERLVAEAVSRGLVGDHRLELSVRPAAFGRLDQATGRSLALAQLRRVCRAAHNAGLDVTLDMEGFETVEPTLELLRELRQDFPGVGIALQAALRRTEQDCRDLAAEGVRVRLVKGAYKLDERRSFDAVEDVDRSYVRCLRILMEGAGYPMVATHDPRMTSIAAALARSYDKGPEHFEYQMYLGIRPLEQTAIADRGDRMRVYVAYGPAWYSYLVRRVAERPTNVTFFVRSLLSRR